MLKISHCSSDIKLIWHQKTRFEINDNSRTCVEVRRYALSNVTVKTSGAINNSLLKASSDQRNISVAMESRVDDITGHALI